MEISSDKTSGSVSIDTTTKAEINTTVGNDKISGYVNLVMLGHDSKRDDTEKKYENKFFARLLFFFVRFFSLIKKLLFHHHFHKPRHHIFEVYLLFLMFNCYF